VEVGGIDVSIGRRAIAVSVAKMGETVEVVALVGRRVAVGGTGWVWEGSSWGAAGDGLQADRIRLMASNMEKNRYLWFMTISPQVI